MNYKFDIILNEYRKHGRDEQAFIIPDMRRDFTLIAGNDNKLKIKIRRRDHWYCNLDVDITGWVFFFTLKVKPTDSDADSIYINDNAVLDEPTEGEATINISLASGESLEGNYLYSLKTKTNKDKIMTLAYGICTFQTELSTRS